MDIQGKSRHTWVRLGPVYGAVVDEKLAAVVYHAEARRGVTGGPGATAPSPIRRGTSSGSTSRTSTTSSHRRLGLPR